MSRRLDSLPLPAFPFRVKVCGVTDLDDVGFILQSGADAVGLNFYNASSRHIGLEKGELLASAFRGESISGHDIADSKEIFQPHPICLVGVFVDPDPVFLKEAVEAATLDIVQLHGQESPSDYLNLDLPPILKALPWNGDRQDEMSIRAWLEARSRLIGLLVDAPSTTLRGGTGHVANWGALYPRPDVLSEMPLVLAGGLKPGNVGEAIRAVRPQAVDVASGVEIAPGKKDMTKVQLFVAEAMAAWQELESRIL